jgi:hypothetical protein
MVEVYELNAMAFFANFCHDFNLHFQLVSNVNITFSALFVQVLHFYGNFRFSAASRVCNVNSTIRTLAKHFCGELICFVESLL